ncbi:alpha/beta fold hydrolase [Nocardia thailandica]|uniref:alpha/beta fold hydrolase n=1 Tax=Nocardia thailandica TaxID=257275 RepID=UPI0002F33D81|nr:alpha/beta fold hydrolase [Nocardia thailandica]
MFDTTPQVTVVALPGTGSDAPFAAAAFASAARARGLRCRAVRPDPRAVIDSYRAALDAAAQEGPVLAAGISLGAAVALDWASTHPGAAVAVVAALPAWTGPGTDGCPAALSASVTAGQLRADGLEPVLAAVHATSPAWLAAALDRAWRSHWPDLPAALDEAAAYAWPTPAELAAVPVPVAVVGAVDDPVHPVAVAERWHALLPHAGLRRVTLEEIGADPGVLGDHGMAILEELNVLETRAAPR